MVTRLVLTLTAGFLLVGIQGGWQSAFSQSNPPAAAGPTIVAQEKTTAAIVEDVDPQARHVLLHLPDDTLVTLKVGPHVNLAEFNPGDHVTARYVEAKLLGINETASASGPIQKMNVASDNTVRGPTTIVSVDPAKHRVSFVGPNNVVETIDVAGDAMIKAVTKLKPGDKADIAYKPAVALNLDRA